MRVSLFIVFVIFFLTCGYVVITSFNDVVSRYNEEETRLLNKYGKQHVVF